MKWSVSRTPTGRLSLRSRVSCRLATSVTAEHSRSQVGQSRSALPDGIAAVDRAVMRRVAHSESRLARSRLVAAVLTGTVPRCCVYGEWLARKGTIASADGVPIWLSVDGEVATVEPGFTQAKRPHGLLVYQPAGNPAGGMPPTAPPWLRKRCSDALHVVRTSVPARLARRGTAPDPTASAGGPDLPPATAISR
jgi:hypothetical protein